MKIVRAIVEALSVGRTICMHTTKILIPAAVAFGAGATANAESYSFSYLGTLGGTYSVANGINSIGQIVGFSGTANGTYHAALWNGTTAIDLGTTGGTYSQAFGINDTGQIVGDTMSAANVMKATVWNGFTLTVLGSAGTASSHAAAVNNTGQIVGFSQLAGSEDYHATVWAGTVATDLGSLGGVDSLARGISNTGLIVGAAYPGQAATQWKGSVASNLNTISGSESSATGVNDAGVVVGYSISIVDGTAISSAISWVDGSETLLATLGGLSGQANGINIAGQVVGMSTVSDGTYHATLWIGGVAYDLNSFVDANAMGTGWYLQDASAINDNGWIVGTALNSETGQELAFKLSVVAIPEPGTYVLMMAGLGALAFRTSQRGRAALRRSAVSPQRSRDRLFNDVPSDRRRRGSSAQVSYLT